MVLLKSTTKKMQTHQDILTKLDSITAQEPSKWLEEADYRYDSKAWLQKSQAVALKILRSLRIKGISQKDLAEKLNVTPQQVNKWVKGTENFTFETISKIEMALNIELMNITMVSERQVEKNTISFRKDMSFEYDKTVVPTNNYGTAKIVKMPTNPLRENYYQKSGS
jgi:ribosome-binding protein aMBF1 (putative translation factor)